MMDAFTPNGQELPTIDDVPQDIRDRILEVQEKAGFVPNVFIALAQRPDEFRAFFAYHDALMEKGGNLTKADREMIVVATSAENNCLYCVVAHGAVLRIRAKHPLVADQVAVNYRKADITPQQKVMLEFAIKVCNESVSVNESDFEKMRDVGYNDEDIWDVVAITAFFGMSNRLANALSIGPNTEFYSMGRSFD